MGINGINAHEFGGNGVSKACLLDSLRGILLSEPTYEEIVRRNSKKK